MLELSEVHHVLKGTRAEVSVTVYDGDAAAAIAGDVTVTVTREDGTELVSGVVAQVSENVATYVLTPSDTSELDNLELAFTVTLDGTEQTESVTVPVVGAYLFGLAEARDFWTDKKKLSNETRVPDALLRSIRDRLAEDFEECTQRSFIPRYKRVTLSGDDTCRLILPDTKVTAIRSIETRNATTGAWETYTPDELAKVRLESGMVIDTVQLFPCGFSNVRIGYEYGYERPPRPVRYAAKILASYQANPPNTDPRATFMADELGQWRIAVPDANRWGRWYGFPEVDAILARFASKDVTIR